MLSMAASWPINKHVKAYCILFLILETGILGVFLALDFFLFYVFWEVMLLPMYFLIGVWGGPRREYAAIKFFLYTLLGGVFMLIAILMLYFASDLKQLSDEQLIAAHAVSSHVDAAAQAEAIAAIRAQPNAVHTFNILAMQQLGQHTKPSASRCCSARACNGGLSCCCCWVLSSRCRRCRCTPGCPTRTSRRRRRSR